MIEFRRQMEAIGTALLLIHKLPGGTAWALTCTNDDDAESPSVLNIFTAGTESWGDIRTALGLGRPTDSSEDENGEQFISFRQGTLLISLIEQEEA